MCLWGYGFDEHPLNLMTSDIRFANHTNDEMCENFGSRSNSLFVGYIVDPVVFTYLRTRLLTDCFLSFSLHVGDCVSCYCVLCSLLLCSFCFCVTLRQFNSVNRL